MAKLACNVVLYRPDPKMLEERFRQWQPEQLLDQASVLIDRCLTDFREYCSLDYIWHQFESELEVQEKQLDIDQKCEAKYSFQREGEEAPEPEPAAGEPDTTEAAAAEAAPEGEKAEHEEAREEEPAPEPERGPVSFSQMNLELRAEAVRRKKELSAPGRPLSLIEQRDLTLKRLCRDYEEAVNRALVAEEGLKFYYGRVELASPLPSEAETLGESITNLAIWIRDSAQWLHEYRQREQAFTRVVSLRSLLNRSLWVQLKQARDSFAVKLQIPPELFRGFENCRLRGIGASLIGEAGKVPWSMLVKLPDQALYERGGRPVEVDQSGRAACLVGRVDRKSAHPVQLCGDVSFWNASPLTRYGQGGLWSIELFKPLGSATEAFGQVEDVVLELALVGVPAPNAG